MCKTCNTNPVYEFTNKRKLCRWCFINYFQRKTLYIIRKFGMIKPRQTIAYRNKNDFRTKALEDILKMFCGKSTSWVVKFSKNKKFDRLAVSNTLDMESEEVISKIIKGDVGKLKFSRIEKNDKLVI